MWYFAPLKSFITLWEFIIIYRVYQIMPGQVRSLALSLASLPFCSAVAKPCAASSKSKRYQTWRASSLVGLVVWLGARFSAAPLVSSTGKLDFSNFQFLGRGKYLLRGPNLSRFIMLPVNNGRNEAGIRWDFVKLTHVRVVCSRICLMVQQFGSHLHTELQQRGVEFTQLFRNYAHLRPALMERMPPMESRRDNSSVAQAHSAHNGVSDMPEVEADDTNPVSSGSVSAILFGFHWNDSIRRCRSVESQTLT